LKEFIFNLWCFEFYQKSVSSYYFNFSKIISQIIFLKIISQIIFLKIFSKKLFFGVKKQKLKYICFEEAALNKMEQCPLCCENQASNQALAIHLKKIHPQRNTAVQLMQ